MTINGRKLIVSDHRWIRGHSFGASFAKNKTSCASYPRHRERCANTPATVHLADERVKTRTREPLSRDELSKQR